jgi:hypothetical protein
MDLASLGFWEMPLGRLFRGVVDPLHVMDEVDADEGIEEIHVGKLPGLGIQLPDGDRLLKSFLIS